MLSPWPRIRTASCLFSQILLFACTVLVCLLAANLLFTTAAGEDAPTRRTLGKRDMGARQFLQEYPEYDGRGVTVAIFDTGVDPGAATLQKTTTGQPKILDLIDGTGNGDVDTSTPQFVEGGRVLGLSGRTLVIPDEWKIRSGKVQLGIKAAYDFFPPRIIQRLKGERRAIFRQAQRDALVQAEKELAEFRELVAGDPQQDSKPESQKWLQELEARKKQLKLAMAGYEDPGPVFDCVVFHDGETWRAAIDTDEDGDLAEEKLLTNFRDERKYGTFRDAFGEDTLLNYALNVYHDGKLLSIVSDCGRRGTHVAAFVAGHDPGNPEHNGAAPGAQIISVKIGDSRVGTDATGTGEVRGLIRAIDHQCDLIHMAQDTTHGSITPELNQRRVSDLTTETAHKHGLILVASAGHRGPALSTLASPSGTNSAILGIGSYVSSEMREAERTLRKKLGERVGGISHTWPSRGPTWDGAIGVNFTAPGGVIPVDANNSLQWDERNSGASMSSSSACGAIALLLSGLKAEEVAYSPMSVRRVLENTARLLEDRDVFAQGCGLLQIPEAWEALQRDEKTFAERSEGTGYEIRIPFGEDGRANEDAGGIYLRDPEEVSGEVERTVQVIPILAPQSPSGVEADFLSALRFESTAPWLKSPELPFVSREGRSFEIRIACDELEAGVHFAELLGFGPQRRERGPLVRIPVTVVRPEQASEEQAAEQNSADSADSPDNLTSGPLCWTRRLQLQAGQLRRHFIKVPRGATWADLTIRGRQLESPRRLVAHAIQHLPHRADSGAFQPHRLTLHPQDEHARSIPVTGGRTLELCLGQEPSSLDETELEVRLEFHGLEPSTRRVVLGPGQRTARVEVAAALRAESLSPEVTIRQLRQILHPSATILRPLTAERDELPGQRRIHELILTYEFKVEKDQEVTFSSALAHEEQAENFFASGLWSVYDEGKQTVKTGMGSQSIELSPGRYTIRYHLRHHRLSALEKLRALAFYADYKLSQPIQLPVHRNPDGIFTARHFYKQRLERGQRAVFYIAAPAISSYPSYAKTGDVLLGEMKLGDMEWGEENSFDPSGRHLRSYSVQCSIVRSPSTVFSQAKHLDPYEPTRLVEQLVGELDDFELQAQIRQLDKLRKAGKESPFLELYEQLRSDASKRDSKRGELPVLLENLYWLDTRERKNHLPSVVRAADAVLEKISRKKLAQHLARQSSARDPVEQEERARWLLRKQILTDTLYRKGRAIAFMDLPPKNEEGIEEDKIPKHPPTFPARDRLFEQNFAELQEWVDTREPQWALLHIRRERRHERPAQALEVLRDYLPRVAPEARLNKKRVDCYKELGWEHWQQYEQRWMLRRFPPDYAGF